MLLLLLINEQPYCDFDVLTTLYNSMHPRNYENTSYMHARRSD